MPAYRPDGMFLKMKGDIMRKLIRATAEKARWMLAFGLLAIGIGTIPARAQTPLIQFAFTNINVFESNTVTLMLTCVPATNASVSYVITDAVPPGPPGAVNHLTNPLSGTISFVNTNRAFLTLPIVYSPQFEGTLPLLISLSSPSAGFVLGSQSNCIVNIDDLNTGFRFDSDIYPMNENSNEVLVTIFRDGNTNGTASIFFRTMEVSATDAVLNNGVGDYLGNPSGIPIFFDDGVRSNQIRITLLDDCTIESNETFTLLLTNPLVGFGTPTIILGTSTVSIADNDTTAGYVGFADLYPNISHEIPPAPLNPAFSVNESLAEPGSSFTINIWVDRPCGSGQISVDYTVIGVFDSCPGLTNAFIDPNDANNPLNDFNLPNAPRPNLTGTLTWGPTDHNPKPIPVVIYNDRWVELDETITLVLRNPQGNPPPTNRADRSVFPLVIHFDDQPAGAADREFNVATQFAQNPGVNNVVFAAAMDGDRIILGGGFTSVQAGDTYGFRGLVRLNSGGYVDTTFDPGSGLSGEVGTEDIFAVYAIGTYPQSSTNAGKVVIGGLFSAYNGVLRYGIARINPNGSLDNTFRVGNGVQMLDGTPGVVRTLKIQDDGGIIIGGDFDFVNSVPRKNIARLNADGSVDRSFDPGTGANGTIWSLATQGAVPINLAAGQSGGGPPEWRTNVNVGANSGVINLFYDLYEVPDTLHIYYDGQLIFDSGLTNGSLQTLVPFGPGASTYITIVVNEGSGNPGTRWDLSLSIIAGGGAEKVIIGGDFTEVGGYARNRVARLNGNGTVDTLFDPGLGADNTVFAVASQASDKKVLIAGAFTTVGVASRNGVARLNTDGSLDLSFYPGTGFDGPVYAMVLQSNDQPYLAGQFTFFNGTGRTNLARLYTNGVLDTSFMDGYYNWTFPGAYRNDPIFGGVIPGIVRCIALQNDGNLIIGGEFDTLGGGYDPWESINIRNVARIIGGTNPPALNMPGNIEFVRSAFTVDENVTSGVANLTVQRINGLLGSLDVNVATVDGSAIAGRDYGPVNLNMSWGHCEIGALTLSVPIYDNQERDPNRDFNIVLTQAPVGTGVYSTNSPALGFLDVTRMTIINDDFERGTIGFSSAYYYYAENAGNAVITVIRTNGLNGTVSVQYSTGSGTASANVDYTPVSGLLTFASGESVKTFNVPLRDDTALEPEETVYLMLSNPNGGAVLGSNTAVLVITDNEQGPGSVGFATNEYRVAESATNLVVTLRRSGGGLLGTAEVWVAAMEFPSGTNIALAGSDFVAVTNKVTFTNGQSVATTSIPLIPDTIVEGPERFRLLIFTNASARAQLGVLTSATAWIVDDDSYGTISFEYARYAVNEQETNVLITLTRVGGSSGRVGVDFATVPLGTPDDAVEGVNYLGVSTTVWWEDGEMGTRTVSIPIIYNPQLEYNRILGLQLSNIQKANYGLYRTASLMIVDREAQLVPAGTVDPAFNPFPGMDNYVHALAIQADGRLLIGGDFQSVNGISRRRIARLNVNGSLDSTFLPSSGFNDTVLALAVQYDQKILAAGRFTTYNNTNRFGIARLLNDGRLDTSFDPGAGADNPIFSISINAAGHIAVGGSFVTFRGINTPNLAVLNTNGTLLTSFKPGTGPNATVHSVLFQPDGKLLIGGDFANYNGQQAVRLARLNADGSLDTTFNTGLGPDGSVRAIALQKDGKIVIGGLFTHYNGVERAYLARLNPDGSLDTTFMNGVSGANGAVYGLSIQTDNKIVVVGDFTRFNGVSRSRITRLFADGTTDPTINFGTGANGYIAAVLNQSDDQIVIAGGFTSFNETPRNYLARLIGYKNQGAGKLEFLRATFNAIENVTNAVITVRRNWGTSNEVRVTYRTLPGTATAGSDYTDVQGVLVFPQGETLQYFQVPIINDREVEPIETVILALSDPTNATLGGTAELDFQNTATLNIISDDNVIGFSRASYSVAENTPAGFAVIAVERYGATNNYCSVDIAASNGTATVGLDFSNVVQTLTFAPGETNQNYLLPIYDDALAEGDETVQLFLTNPSGAYLGLAQATLTIVDNDFAAGQLQFDSAVYTVNEYETNITIRVIRTNGVTGVVTVDYSTRDGTATAGLDYTAVAGSLTFANGETVKTFNIPITPDYLAETNETVLLRLSNPRGAAGVSLGPISQATLTIINNPLINGNIVFSSTNYTANESALQADITVYRLFGGAGAITVDYATTTNGTAVAGHHYLPTNGVLSWPDGDMSPRTFRVTILSNDLVEGDVTVGLELSNVTGGASFGALTNATLTIHDESTGPGALRFAETNYMVFENATNAVITVVRTNGSLGTVTVDYQTAGLTGRPGIDYLDVSGTLVFTNGQTNASFTVPVIERDGADLNKRVRLLLSNPTGGAVLGQPDNSVLVIVESSVVAGSLNGTFAPLLDGPVNVIYIQTNTDNKILIAGDFTQVDGNPRPGLARLNPNGSLDVVFNAGAGANGQILCLRTLEDGRVLVGGNFTVFGPSVKRYLARLQVDGTLDGAYPLGAGPDNAVHAAVEQLDGRVVIGGQFTSVSGYPRAYIARLMPDGSVDTNFLAASVGADGPVHALAVQAQDGKIVIAGDFQNVNGVPRAGIARLWPDGSLDTSFNPGLGANGSVRTLVLDTEGRVIIGGRFTTVDMIGRNRIARLNVDGSVDLSFDPGQGADDHVASIALQSDGKLVVGGSFTTFNGYSRNRLVRLNANGSVDTSFNIGTGANNYINAVAIQADQRIVVGGGFTMIHEQPQAYLARLNGGFNIGPGSIGFAAATFSVLENASNIVITVVRDIGTAGAVSIAYTTRDDTALAGLDYGAVSGTLYFPDGETIQTFVVPIYDNPVPTSNRTVLLELSNPTGGSELGINAIATLTVVDDDGLISFSQPSYSFNEGVGDAIIEVVRTAGTVGQASVDFAVSNLTAEGGLDFVPVTGTLLFTNGQTNAFIRVPILEDSLLEGNETAFLSLFNPVGATLGRSNATLIIVDNEYAAGQLGFESASYLVNEFEGYILVRVIRTNGSSGAVSVDFTTIPGTATPFTDYMPTNGTLSFADGETVRSFIVPIVADYLPELNETVMLQLSNPRGAAGVTLGANAQATLTIVNNNLINGVLSLAATNYSVMETAGVLTVTVTRGFGSQGEVAVNYSTVPGTADTNRNYTPVSGVLTWPDGDTSPRTFTVPILANDLVEGDLTFGVVLTNAQGGATLGVWTNALVTVVDATLAPGALTFASTNFNVLENATNAVITVVMRSNNIGLVSVDYATFDGSGVNGLDYLSVTGRLYFVPGQATNIFTVPVIDRPGFNLNRTVGLRLFNPMGGAVLGVITNATLTILESTTMAGSANVAFAPLLNGPVEVVDVRTNTDGRIIIAGSFSVVNGIPRFNLARLETNGAVDLNFDPGTGPNAPIRSLLSLDDGRLLVGGGFSSFAGSGQGFLVRLDVNGAVEPGWPFGSQPNNSVEAIAVQPDGNVLIGGSFSALGFTPRSYLGRLLPNGFLDTGFLAGLSGPNGIVRALAVQASDGKIYVAGDFTAVNGVSRNRIARLYPDGSLDLSFAPNGGANASVRTLVIQGDGRVLIGGSFTTVNGVSRGRIARLNTDGSLDLSFNPGAGADEFVSSLALQSDGKIIAGGGFATFNGYARSRLVRLLPDGTVDSTFNVGTGANNYISSVQVEANQDLVVGGGFTEFNGVAQAYLARISGGINYGGGVLRFASTNFSVMENGSNAVVTVVRDGGTVGELWVNYFTVDAGALAGVDYQPAAGALHFADGQTLQTITIPVFDNSQPTSNRLFTVWLTNVSGGAVLAASPQTSVTIVEDDPLIQFAQADYAVNEDGFAALINVIRPVGYQGASAVDYIITDGTATGPDDYTAFNGTLTFAPGETNAFFIVIINDDFIAEGNETINLALANPTNATLGLSNAVLTIVDNEQAPGMIGFSVTNYTVMENAVLADIAVRRTAGSAGNVSVSFVVGGGTATAGLDYVATNGVIQFADGETLKTFTVRILDDNLTEGNEVVGLALLNPTGGAFLDPQLSTATLTIRDDDGAPGAFRFDAVSYFANESLGVNFAVITILRTNGDMGDVSVDVATSDGTALAGADYVGLTNRLYFTNRQVSQTISIPINDDLLFEGDETFTVRLFNPLGGATLASPSNATVVIRDNEAVIQFTAANYTVSEDGAFATITVVRSGGLFGSHQVTYSTSDGTAQPGDYMPVSGVLTFNLGDTVRNFVVPIMDNTQTNASRTVMLHLSSPQGGAVLGALSNAVLTILDNDSVIAFGAPSYSVAENAGSLTVTLTRAGSVGVPVSVNLSTVNGSAVGGVDFVPVSQTVFFGAGETNRSVNIPIIDNSRRDVLRSFQIQLGSPSVGAIIGTPAVTVTLVDDDNANIVPAGAVLVAESQSPTNNVIDSGETVTMNLALRNVGNLPATNLVAVLLATNGVASPSGPQSYGYLAASGGSATRTFTFTAAAPNGATIIVTLRLSDGTNDLGVAQFPFQVGRGAGVFANTNAIIINDATNATMARAASPYPSQINVSGLGGKVSKVTVTLNRITHTYPEDIGVMLIGPEGQKALLMSRTVGGWDHPLNQVTLSFDDAATNALPASGGAASGTYRPTSYGVFGFPAPVTTNGAVAALSVFNGSSPNGMWSLYVVDQAVGDDGLIAGGWTLSIETTDTIQPSVDLLVNLNDQPDPVVTGGLLSYTVSVTNRGPAAATGVKLTNWLPANVTLVSNSMSHLTSLAGANVLVLNVGTLTNNGAFVATFVVQASGVGTITNMAAVGANEPDTFASNNQAVAVTMVNPSTPPQVAPVSRLSAGQFQLTITGTPGTLYYIEARTSLTSGTWQRIATNILSGSSAVFTDPASLGVGARFYRVVLP